MKWWRERQRRRFQQGLPPGLTRQQRVGLLLVALLLALGAVVALSTFRERSGDMTGVTIATVDGSPVTEAQLAAEAMANGLPAARADDPATRPGLIARVIDRRLLANAARAQKIDDNPAFVAAQARAAEAMLADTLAQRFIGPGGGANDVDDATARRYMAAHPAMFAGRETFLLDRIVYADPSGGSVTALKNADRMRDVEQVLRSIGVRFDRGDQRLDSAALPAELAAKIAVLKPDELFMVPSGTGFLVARLAGRLPAVAPEADQLTAARAAVRRAQAGARIDAAIRALRAKATIRYVSAADRPAR